MPALFTSTAEAADTPAQRPHVDIKGFGTAGDVTYALVDVTDPGATTPAKYKAAPGEIIHDGKIRVISFGEDNKTIHLEYLADNAAAKPAPAATETAKAELKVGDDAPDFEIPSTLNAGATKLSEFEGKKNVLIAFYPKADTPGCTKQLCGYRDEFEKFKGADTVIIAISADKQEDSDKFKNKFTMPFTVLGDKEGKIIDAYGVPKMGPGLASRSVFLVDKQGKISCINMKYDVEGSKSPLFDSILKLEPKTVDPGKPAADKPAQ